MAKCVVMCQWLKNKIKEEPEFIGDVLVRDETHFLPSGHVNSKNNEF